MRNFTIIVFLILLGLYSCAPKGPLASVENKVDNKIGNAVMDTIKNFGYVPIDPMPVKVNNYDGFFNITNSDYLNALSDETILVATGIYNKNGTVTFGPIGGTITGKKYVVILDWIKYTTLSQLISENMAGEIELYDKYAYNKTDFKGKINSIPIYEGIGLRIQATFIATSANLDVNGIFGLSGKVDSSSFKGSIVIQSMGISGKSVNLPLPSDINPTSIQNALMAISSIRALVYTSDNKDLKITPRIIGFYNTIGDKTNRDQMVSFLSSLEIPFIVSPTAEQQIDFYEKNLKTKKKLRELEKLYNDEKVENISSRKINTN